VALLQLGFGIYHATQKVAPVTQKMMLSMRTDLVMDFFVREHRRLSELLVKVRLYAQLENLGGLLGLLLAILRFRIPMVWVFFGAAIMVECIAHYILDTSYDGVGTAYLEFLNSALASSTSQTDSAGDA
jgi:hypothetical protein